MQLSFTVNEFCVLLREAYQAGQDSIEKGFCSKTSLDDAYRDDRLTDMIERKFERFLLRKPDDA